MGCPEKSKIEQLIAGVLDEDDSKNLLAHLTGCPDCRQEAALLTAVRLSLPTGPPGPKCLSDESLSLLRDDLLPDREREEALSHLSECHRCLSAWVSLDRSLEEAAREPVSPPAHLVRKAAALGGVGEQTEKISFLQRLLGPSPSWRLSLASAAAVVVLVLTVVLSVQTTKQPAPEIPVLVADDTRPVEPPAPVTGPGEPSEIPPAPVEPVPSGKAARLEGNWLAALPGDKRLDLVKGLKPQVELPRVETGKAFKTPDRQASIADGYQLGRHLGYLLAFAEQLDNPPAVRAQLAQAAGSMVPMLRTLAPEQGGKRLVDFSRDLHNQLASNLAPDSARRKLEVFKTALLEALPAEEPTGLGFELGLLASQFEVASTAQKLGYGPPRRTWPSRKSVSRVRTLVRKVKSLPDEDKREVLSSLERIEQMVPAPQTPARASKILEEIHTIDRNVRATR
jgi:anti-sigma factor RsiW